MMNGGKVDKQPKDITSISAAVLQQISVLLAVDKFFTNSNKWKITKYLILFLAGWK